MGFQLTQKIIMFLLLQDSWIGRELTSFLHRKDVVTVNSSYTYEDPEHYDSTFLKCKLIDYFT